MTVEVNSWFGTAEVELIPGVLNEDARHAFTTGQCHSLALALAERTGWEVVGLCWDEDIPDAPHHVAVQASDGRLLDVEGWGVEERWEHRWGTIDPGPVDIDYLVEQDYYRPTNIDAGRAFAEAVLRQYAPEVLR